MVLLVLMGVGVGATNDGSTVYEGGSNIYIHHIIWYYGVAAVVVFVGGCIYLERESESE